jgi:hypothetical protein
MSETNTPGDRMASLLAAHAVLSTVQHILSVSTDMEDARRQVRQLMDLVRDKAEEEQVPAAMLREGGRELLLELL